MKTLNVMNVKEEDVLNRTEMKAIMAGSGYGGSGNIYCRIGSQEVPCRDKWNLTECTDACADVAYMAGTDCGGCAQFP